MSVQVWILNLIISSFNDFYDQYNCWSAWLRITPFYFQSPSNIKIVLQYVLLHTVIYFSKVHNYTTFLYHVSKMLHLLKLIRMLHNIPSLSSIIQINNTKVFIYFCCKNSINASKDYNIAWNNGWRVEFLFAHIS